LGKGLPKFGRPKLLVWLFKGCCPTQEGSNRQVGRFPKALLHSKGGIGSLKEASKGTDWWMPRL